MEKKSFLTAAAERAKSATVTKICNFVLFGRAARLLDFFYTLTIVTPRNKNKISVSKKYSDLAGGVATGRSVGVVLNSDEQRLVTKIGVFETILEQKNTSLIIRGYDVKFSRIKAS